MGKKGKYVMEKCFVNSFGYVLMELNESLSAINEDTLQ
jgi:hypothetical protein